MEVGICDLFEVLMFPSVRPSVGLKSMSSSEGHHHFFFCLSFFELTILRTLFLLLDVAGAARCFCYARGVFCFCFGLFHFRFSWRRGC